MTDAKINAIVASAFNLAAAEEPSIRRVHPNGMTPAIAATLPKSVRLGWVESYEQRINRFTPAEQEKRGFIYGVSDVYAALAALRA
jgi:hypothetical protein